MRYGHIRRRQPGNNQPSMPPPDIFISYRIADTLPQAGRLHDALAREFGNEAVFYDKNSLKPGMKWPKELAEKVGAAKVVLVLYADPLKWMGVSMDAFGITTRRIDDPEDWVRKELEAALADTQKLVIPILINEAKLPPPSALPKELHPLLACQHKQIREANWSDDLLPLVKILREHLDSGTEDETKQDRGKERTHLGFHAYTCNRDGQFSQFEGIEPSLQPGTPHFFYLYGGEMQAHKSFFQRIRHYLEGKYPKPVDAVKKQPHSVVALDFVVESEGCSSPERLRERFVRDLCTAFGLSPSNYHPLTQQNLLNLLLDSEKTRDLRAGSHVCVFAHISHWYWNPRLTPDAARWFMETFCPAQLPTDSPAVLFFFAFDFNEDENPGVRDEVVQIVEAEAARVMAFSELDMVERKHVAQWLVRYQRYFSAPLRQQILAKHFAKPEYFMEELEPDLRTLIDDYFNTQTT